MEGGIKLASPLVALLLLLASVACPADAANSVCSCCPKSSVDAVCTANSAPMYQLPDPCPSRDLNLRSFYSAFLMPSSGWQYYADLPFDASKGYASLGATSGADTEYTSATFVPDPTGNSSATVLQMIYRAGGYGGSGGLNFNVFPTGVPLGQEARLQYKLYFSPTFDWVNGGKLPGFYGTVNANGGCTGGEWEPGCWSLRLMWRAQGEGEAYLYVPPASQSCQLSGLPGTQLDCDALNGGTCAGISVARGVAAFKRGVWQTVDVYVKMNTVGQQDGAIALALDGQTLLYFDQLVYRTSSTPTITSILFVTFFGGGSPRWAPTTDQTAYFRDLKIWSNDNPNSAFVPGPSCAEAAVVTPAAAPFPAYS